MKKATSMLLLIMLVCLLSGCNVNGKIDNILSSNEHTVKQTEIENSNNINTDKIQNSEINTLEQEEKEVFYGNWIIKKSINTGTVSAYGAADIDKLLGKKISYTQQYAVFDNEKCFNPIYKKVTYTANEFFTVMKFNYSVLGITDETITGIEIYTDKSRWHSTGNYFLLKDQNTLILRDQGVYFELERDKK